MSNTIVTNYSNSSENSKTGDNPYVIIVNKDGAVALEREEIRSLTNSDYQKKTFSVVRVKEDGKPEDASDHSSDESIPHVNLSVDAFFDSIMDKDDGDSKVVYSCDLFGNEIALIGLRNDHCYTSLTSANLHRRDSESDIRFKDEKRPFLSNVQKQFIPSSKKIHVIENKIIAKGKNVQYYSVNNAGDVSKTCEIMKRPVNALSQNSQLVKKVEVDRNVGTKTTDSPDDTVALDKDIGGSEQNLRFDLDENVGSKSLLKKDVKKILSRKIELKNNGSISTTPHMERNQNINKKIKSYSAQKIIGDRAKASLLRNDAIRMNDSLKQNVSSKMNDMEIEKDVSMKMDPQKSQKLIVKKDKKQGTHSTALLNDMTALFSTPDVIRRVSTDSKPPKTPDKIVSNVVKKLDQVASYPVSISDNIDTSQNSKWTSKTDVRSPTSTITRVTSKSADLIKRSKNQKDTNLDIMSFDEVNFADLLQDTNPGILASDNISTDMTPVTVQTQLLDKNDVTNAIGSTNTALMSPTSASTTGLNPPLSPSLDLLGGIHPEEEGLSEDLLRHVAQLVESSENLQEVIDKQVLGTVNDMTSKDSTLKNVQSQQPSLISIEHNVTPNLPIESSKPQNTLNNNQKKEPIQIIRSNGRVITLPPIEAPATRSSKRKSMMNASGDSNLNVLNLDITKAQQTPKQPVHTNSKVQKAADYLKSQFGIDKKEDDAESDESWNSEDDPDRLWCICKQPHNNRFMICCDSCEDWFHGKCVNVTKAMGNEMEEKGIEWRCPNCVKKKGVANPSLKSLQQRKSTDGRSDDKLLTPNISDTSTNCIVCKKLARADSIFCSDACILRHAQESLNIAIPPSTNAKSARNTPGNKFKTETRVIVLERKSGKILSGQNAPTTSNLRTWLQEHPTYEVVQPETNINRSPNLVKVKPKTSTPKVQSVLTFGQDKQISFTTPPSKNVLSTSKILTKSPQIPNSPSLKSPPATSKNQTTKVPLKSPSTPKIQSPQTKPPLKSPTTLTHKKEESPLARFNTGTDPIRENVRKTLREEIHKRMLETQGVKFSQEDIVKFSNDTEFELHDLFKDVGTKYKAKYRSLMFNLKDRKNLTLWQKICDRSITPKQLVRLSAEELASQELAQWRDKEAKHQLELIKKSELDLLACNKTYVLKTHKGEEVMETRTAGTAELDPNVPVEDLVSVLNKSVDVGGNVIDNSNKKTSPTPHRDNRHSSHHKHSKHKSKSSKSSRSSRSDRSSSRHENSSSKHKSSRDSRSGSHSSSNHRKSSRERDRKGSSSSSKRHNEPSRRSSHSKSSSRHSDDDRKSSDQQNSRDSDKKIEKDYLLMGLENIRSPVLYDSKGDDLNELGSELLSPNSASPKSPKTPDIRTNQKIRGSTESDQEPSSTMESIVWNGVINMNDVARFSVSALEISGQSDDVVSSFDGELDVIGRIVPETVWSYISKMRKQGYNDILLLRFNTVDEEKNQYMALYNYLSTRNRLGVITGNIGVIKDFYILPLASNASLPSILLPTHGPTVDKIKAQILVGIIVKQRRKRPSQPNPLSAIPSKIAKLALPGDRSYTPPTESSYTPPSSPKRKIPMSSGILTSFLPNLSSTVKDKIAASLASVDDDEPYSPGGSDSGSLERSQSPTPKNSLIPSTSDDLQKKMEELNRRIAEEKKQIENIAVTISADSLDEPYSPSRPMSPSTSPSTLPEFSSINLPSNLQEILATIHKNSKVASGEMTDSQSSTETYVPQPIISSPSINSLYYKEGFAGDVDMRMMNSTSYTGYSQSQSDVPPKSTGKLSTLSEAELLSMVPDDEVLLPPAKSTSVYPPLPSIPPPILTTDTSVPPPPFKRQSMDFGQPPPPGFD